MNITGPLKIERAHNAPQTHPLIRANLPCSHLGLPAAASYMRTGGIAAGNAEKLKYVSSLK